MKTPDSNSSAASSPSGPREFKPAELESYLDEALSPADMAAVELALRDRPELLRELADIHHRRDAGVHSLGEMWRRHRVSCPTREQLGSHLLGALPEADARYIAFHLEQLGCRYCRANLSDLENKQREAADAAAGRRHRYFQSSAGYLRRPDR
jgi:hypothetical protein